MDDFLEYLRPFPDSTLLQFSRHFTVLVLLITMAIVGMRPMPDPHDDAALLLVLKFVALALIANAVGRLAVRWLRRSKLRFLRTYQHG